MDEKKKLYDVLVRDGYYTKSYEDFNSQWNDSKYRDKVYEVASREGLFTKNRGDFESKYFGGDVKKKAEPESTPADVAVLESPSNGETNKNPWAITEPTSKVSAPSQKKSTANEIKNQWFDSDDEKDIQNGWEFITNYTPPEKAIEDDKASLDQFPNSDWQKVEPAYDPYRFMDPNLLQQPSETIEGTTNFNFLGVKENAQNQILSIQTSNDQPVFKQIMEEVRDNFTLEQISNGDYKDWAKKEFKKRAQFTDPEALDKDYLPAAKQFEYELNIPKNQIQKQYAASEVDKLLEKGLDQQGDILSQSGKRNDMLNTKMSDFGDIFNVDFEDQSFKNIPISDAVFLNPDFFDYSKVVTPEYIKQSGDFFGLNFATAARDRHLNNYANKEAANILNEGKKLFANSGSEEGLKAYQERYYRNKMTEKAQEHMSPWDKELYQDIATLEEYLAKASKSELSYQEQDEVFKLNEKIKKRQAKGSDRIYDPETGNFLAENDPSIGVSAGVWGKEVDAFDQVYKDMPLSRIRKSYEEELLKFDELERIYSKYQEMGDKNAPIIKEYNESLQKIQSLQKSLIRNYDPVKDAESKPGFVGGLGRGIASSLSAGGYEGDWEQRKKDNEYLMEAGKPFNSEVKDFVTPGTTQRWGEELGANLGNSAKIGLQIFLGNKIQGIMGIPKLIKAAAGSSKLKQTLMTEAFQANMYGNYYDMAGENYWTGIGEYFGEGMAGKIGKTLGIDPTGYGGLMVRWGGGALGEIPAEFAGEFAGRIAEGEGFREATVKTLGLDQEGGFVMKAGKIALHSLILSAGPAFTGFAMNRMKVLSERKDNESSEELAFLEEEFPSDKIGNYLNQLFNSEKTVEKYNEIKDKPAEELSEDELLLKGNLDNAVSNATPEQLQGTLVGDMVDQVRKEEAKKKQEAIDNGVPAEVVAQDAEGKPKGLDDMLGDWKQGATIQDPGLVESPGQFTPEGKTSIADPNSSYTRKWISQNVEPRNIREAVLKYFIGGGKINEAEIANETGFSKEYSPEERNLRKSLYGQNTIHDITQGIADAYPEMFENVDGDVIGSETWNEVRNEIIDVMSSHTDMKSMTNELYDEHSVEGRIFANENDYLFASESKMYEEMDAGLDENIGLTTLEEVSALDAEQFEQARQDEVEFINNLTDEEITKRYGRSGTEGVYAESSTGGISPISTTEKEVRKSDIGTGAGEKGSFGKSEKDLRVKSGENLKKIETGYEKQAKLFEEKGEDGPGLVDDFSEVLEVSKSLEAKNVKFAPQGATNKSAITGLEKTKESLDSGSTFTEAVNEGYLEAKKTSPKLLLSTWQNFISKELTEDFTKLAKDKRIAKILNYTDKVAKAAIESDPMFAALVDPSATTKPTAIDALNLSRRDLKKYNSVLRGIIKSTRKTALTFPQIKKKIDAVIESAQKRILADKIVELASTKNLTKESKPGKKIGRTTVDFQYFANKINEILKDPESVSLDNNGEMITGVDEIETTNGYLTPQMHNILVWMKEDFKTSKELMDPDSEANSSTSVEQYNSIYQSLKAIKKGEKTKWEKTHEAKKAEARRINDELLKTVWGYGQKQKEAVKKISKSKNHEEFYNVLTDFIDDLNSANQLNQSPLERLSTIFTMGKMELLAAKRAPNNTIMQEHKNKAQKILNDFDELSGINELREEAKQLKSDGNNSEAQRVLNEIKAIERFKDQKLISQEQINGISNVLPVDSKKGWELYKNQSKTDFNSATDISIYSDILDLSVLDTKRMEKLSQEQLGRWAKRIDSWTARVLFNARGHLNVLSNFGMNWQSNLEIMNKDKNPEWKKYMEDLVDVLENAEDQVMIKQAEFNGKLREAFKIEKTKSNNLFDAKPDELLNKVLAEMNENLDAVSPNNIVYTQLEMSNIYSELQDKQNEIKIKNTAKEFGFGRDVDGFLKWVEDNTGENARILSEVSREYFKTYIEPLNKYYEEVLGVPAPINDTYYMRDVAWADPTLMEKQRLENNTFYSLNQNSVHTLHRAASTTALSAKPIDGFQNIIGYIKNITFFLETQAHLDHVNRLVTNDAFDAAIKANQGEFSLNQFKGTLKNIIEPPFVASTMLYEGIKNVALSSLMMNVSAASKQVASYPLFFAEGYKGFWSPKKSADVKRDFDSRLNESVKLTRRYGKKGFNVETGMSNVEAVNYNQSARKRLQQRIRSFDTKASTFVDKEVVVPGMRIAYPQFVSNEAQKMYQEATGKPISKVDILNKVFGNENIEGIADSDLFKEQAKKAGFNAVFRFANATQQSNISSYKTSAQIQNPAQITSLLTLFKTALIQQHSKAMQHAVTMGRSFKNPNLSNKEKARSITRNAFQFGLYHTAVPVLFKVLQEGLFGKGAPWEWDEDEWKELGIYAGIGNLSGVMIVGDFLSAGVNVLMEKPYGKEVNPPLTSVLNKGLQLMEGDSENLKLRPKELALVEFYNKYSNLNYALNTIGVNFDPIVRHLKSVYGEADRKTLEELDGDKWNFTDYVQAAFRVVTAPSEFVRGNIYTPDGLVELEKTLGMDEGINLKTSYSYKDGDMNVTIPLSKNEQKYIHDQALNAFESGIKKNGGIQKFAKKLMESPEVRAHVKNTNDLKTEAETNGYLYSIYQSLDKKSPDKIMAQSVQKIYDQIFEAYAAKYVFKERVMNEKMEAIDKLKTIYNKK